MMSVLAWVNEGAPWLVFGLFALVAVLYGVKVLRHGRPNFYRIDKQGGSPLLGKPLMEFGYWLMQPVARGLLSFGVTADAVSWASLFLGILAAGCVLAGHFGSAGFFLIFSGYCDAIDGFMARESGLASRSGEVLDASIDRYNEIFLCVALVIYYRALPWVSFAAIMALVGSFMVSYSSARAELFQVKLPASMMRRPERAFYLTIGALLTPVSVTFFEEIRTTPIKVGYPMVFAVVLVAIVSNVVALDRLADLRRILREKDLKEGLPEAGLGRGYGEIAKPAAASHSTEKSLSTKK